MIDKSRITREWIDDIFDAKTLSEGIDTSGLTGIKNLEVKKHLVKE